MFEAVSEKLINKYYSTLLMKGKQKMSELYTYINGELCLKRLLHSVKFVGIFQGLFFDLEYLVLNVFLSLQCCFMPLTVQQRVGFPGPEVQMTSVEE